MADLSAPKLSRWPFLIADLMLLSAAAYIALSNHGPLQVWWMFGLAGSVALAAWAGVAPFLVQHRTDLKFAEAQSLTSAVEQISNLRAFTNQISFATAQWQVMQAEASKTVAASRQIAEGITAEAKAFSNFMQKASDAEKAHLRLEVEKLRRGEGEWLQVLVMMLDHVYALYLAGRRSGQQNIIQQLSTFQHACRDVARKVGLVAFEAQPNEAFNAQLHQLLDAKATPTATAHITDTLAPGYMFQGQLIRGAVVTLQPQETAVAEPELMLAEQERRT